MNVSSQAIVIPTNHQRRRLLPGTHKSMFPETSPIGVSNKIKAIQSRKTRLNPVLHETEYTNIQPLNFGYSNSKDKLTVWTAEKLCNRSKGFRLDRIPTRPTIVHRPSAYSTALMNQQTGLWTNKQQQQPLQTNRHSPTITPPHDSVKNKSVGGKMPEIVPQQRTQQTDLPRPLVTSSNETLEHENDLVMDKEFAEYFEKAIVKCADWLLKYVFIDDK